MIDRQMSELLLVLSWALFGLALWLGIFVLVCLIGWGDNRSFIIAPLLATVVAIAYAMATAGSVFTF